MLSGYWNLTTVERTDTWDEVYEPLPASWEPSWIMSNLPCLAFSPDGPAIITTEKRWGEEGSLQVWDAATGSLRARITDPRHDSCCYSYGRGKVHIQRQSPECLALWNDVLGSMSHCFGGPSSSVMFSEDSRYLLTGSHTDDENDTTARLWSVATGELIREFSGHAQPVLCVAISLDAKRIATGSEDTSIIIWNVNTGASLATCKNDAPVTSVAFSASGKRVVSGSWDGGVTAWNAKTGKPLRSFWGSEGAVWSVAFTPGGDAVISSEVVGFHVQEHMVCLRDIKTGDRLHTFREEIWYRDIELAPDGTGVIVPGGRVVRLWAPLEADMQPTTTHPWLPRRTWPFYYIEDGWLFSLAPARRTRLCWLPVDWREVKGYFSHTVVLKGRRTLDLTGLNSYLDTLHSAAR